MAESLHEQISAALQARLKTIESDGGDTYWYTPDAVYRVLEFTGADLDDSRDLTLFLRPDEDTITEGATTRVEGIAPFTVLIAHRDLRASKSPGVEESDEAPTGATIIGRCVADVRAALISEVTLGGLAWNVINGASTADYSYAVEGWLCATVTFSVKYDYAA